MILDDIQEAIRLVDQASEPPPGFISIPQREHLARAKKILERVCDTVRRAGALSCALSLPDAALVSKVLEHGLANRWRSLPGIVARVKVHEDDHGDIEARVRSALALLVKEGSAIRDGGCYRLPIRAHARRSP